MSTTSDDSLFAARHRNIHRLYLPPCVAGFLLNPACASCGLVAKVTDLLRPSSLMAYPYTLPRYTPPTTLKCVWDCRRGFLNLKKNGFFKYKNPKYGIFVA